MKKISISNQNSKVEILILSKSLKIKGLLINLVKARKIETFLLFSFSNQSRWFLVQTKGSPLWYQVGKFFFLWQKNICNKKGPDLKKKILLLKEKIWCHYIFGHYGAKTIFSKRNSGFKNGQKSLKNCQTPIFFAYLFIPRKLEIFLLLPFSNTSRWFLVQTKGSPLWYQVGKNFFALTKKSMKQKRTRFLKENFFINMFY